MYCGFFKRFIHNMRSFCTPVMLATSTVIFAIIKLDSKNPVLFRQKRAGVHKEIFMMPTHLLNDPGPPCGTSLA